ncbi:770952e9-a8a5-431c-ae46-c1b349d11bdf [Sclerotinia trifoliorum]|uniref:770952e9-a8a5-431c-ae46-c1b349d11bdf n=1 Tax=Sclerotinia trifoliorum TaxID=28548 RepID=A0A8H2VZC8_9HELO|nr:770952e9-a8a5-431c-ae46-c1b349d11bdf [Sclerotinia trifoliorum]
MRDKRDMYKPQGVVYNGSDSDTVYTAREDGCVYRSTIKVVFAWKQSFQRILRLTSSIWERKICKYSIISASLSQGCLRTRKHVYLDRTYDSTIALPFKGGPHYRRAFAAIAGRSVGLEP